MLHSKCSSLLLLTIACLSLLVSAAHAQNIDSESKEQNDARPGLFEVDEDAATRALERSLIQFDALLLSPGHAESGLVFSFTSDEQSTPVLLEGDSNTVFVGESSVRTESTSLRFNLQIGLPWKSQIELSVPYNNVHEVTSAAASGLTLDHREASAYGVGDVQLTLLKTLLTERGRRPDVIGILAVDADTANKDTPVLGSNAIETTIGINATKRQDPLVFTFGLSHTVANSDTEFQSGATSRMSAGTVLAASPYTSLRFSYSQIYNGDSSLSGIVQKDSSNLGAVLQLGVASIVSQTVFMSGTVQMGLSDTATDYSLSVGMTKRFDFLK